MIDRFGTVVSSLRDFILGARRAIRESLFAPQVLEALARVGYTVRGIVYLLVAGLAAASAMSETSVQSLGQALSTVADLPAGVILVGAIALGLFAYASWRFAEAVLDLGSRGWHGKGLLLRSAILLDALFQAGLGILATIVALGWIELIGGEEAMGEVWAERALDWPLGHWIVGLFGLCAIALGIGQIAKGYRVAFEDIRAAESVMRMIRIVGRIGLGARGAIFALIGALLLLAAWRADASAAGGIKAALLAAASLPLGNWVLLCVAAGLAFYGAFGVIKGWFHKRPNV